MKTNKNQKMNSRKLWLTSLFTMSILLVFNLPDLSALTSDHGINEIQSEPKKILAVFGHPDDESIVGPMLARYVREGVEVTIVTATDGRLGTNDWSGYSAGDELAAVRRGEMQCAADALGANLYHLTYEDQFKAAEGYQGFIPQSRGFLDDLHMIMEEVQPDVVVTFGPDGFSNHIDHRIAGVSATQVVLSKEWDKKPNLFFAATPSSILNDNFKYQGTADIYLTVRVSFEEEDLMRARESALCHASQFRPEFVDSWTERMRDRGKMIYLRPFEAPKHSADDLFSYPSQY